ncbi:MAG TPA: GntR family transcriptional regulator [Acidimicrobiia bacterium]|nr:GntR family transcriptional regulator [Acidimicrobiia bacterium]
MTATNRAYAHTKERVLDGTYPGGTLITEGDVSAAVGVSRTPVREAFLRLQAEGLLRLYPKRGALVVPVSAREVDDVMEARALVERFAVEKVIASATHPEVGARLADSLARQRRLRKSPEPFTEADRDFHGLLVAATGNQVLVDLYALLRDRQLRMGVSALARDPGRTDTILEEHAELAGAIAAGDRDGALTCVARHLHGTEVALRHRAPL